MDEYDYLSAAEDGNRGINFRVRLIEIIFEMVMAENSSQPLKPPMTYSEIKSRMMSLLNTNSVSETPPPAGASWDTPISTPAVNLGDKRGGGAPRRTRARGAARRGLPGRGTTRATMASRLEKPDVKGSIPNDYKKFRDGQDREVCVKFNKETGCNEVKLQSYTNMCKN